MTSRENFLEAFRVVLRLNGCRGVQQDHKLHELEKLAASSAEFSPNMAHTL
jgi:hypothetical protein